MSSAAILLLVQGIQAALVAAPQAIEVAIKSKELVAALFRAGVISADKQDAINLRIDAIAEDVAANRTPSHWTIEPDPV